MLFHSDFVIFVVFDMMEQKFLAQRCCLVFTVSGITKRVIREARQFADLPTNT